MEKRYMMLESKLCKELELLEEKYRTGAEMSEGDLRKIDLLAHAMKSLVTYTAMKEAENRQGYSANVQSYSGNSYGRDSMGRYASRDMGPDMSGHVPYYPAYPDERRW